MINIFLAIITAIVAIPMLCFSISSLIDTRKKYSKHRKGKLKPSKPWPKPKEELQKDFLRKLRMPPVQEPRRYGHIGFDEAPPKHTRPRADL